MGFFSAIGDFVGNIFGVKSEEKMAKRQMNREADNRVLSRSEYLADRKNERNYNASLTKGDRKYAESLMAKDRKYAEKLLFGDRDYARKITNEERAYNERMLGKDRKYAETVYEKERRNLAASKVVDANAYKADRKAMQALADKQAIKTAASRGIDFQRLRDDATKAGFNPLTAMQWASAYNTEKGFGVMGDVYSGTASSPSQVIPGRSAGGGAPSAGGGMAGSTPMVSSINPGANGFSAPGGGYGSTSLPSFISADLGASLGNLIDTGLNWFNHKDDAKYEAIADQVARGQLAREYENQTPRAFGYSLAKIEPYRPSIGVYAPPLRASDAPGISPSDTALAPSKQPLSIFGYPIAPSGDTSDQEAIETRYGGGVGEVVGAISAVRDTYNAGLPLRGAGRDAFNTWADGYQSSKPYLRGRGTEHKVSPQVPRGSGSFSLTGAFPKMPAFFGW